MQMYVCWCSGKSIAKTKTNHYNIFKTCNYYYNELGFLQYKEKYMYLGGQIMSWSVVIQE